MFGAVSANLFHQRGEEKQVTPAKHFYLALELITWISPDKLIFMGEKTQQFWKRKEQFSYQKVNLSMFVYLPLHGLTSAFKLRCWLFAP